MVNENEIKGFDSTPNVTYIHKDKVGGRPPTGDDDMERRVSALEKSFEKMDGKLDTIIKDTSYLKGKVESLPSTLQLLGFVIAVLAIAGLAKYFAP
jgi:hypothetical protein